MGFTRYKVVKSALKKYVSCPEKHFGVVHRHNGFICFSVFEGCIIPYPKREFLTDEEEEKGSVATSKVSLV